MSHPTDQHCDTCACNESKPVKGKKIVKMYLHGNKEANWEQGEEIGLSEKAIRENFAYALYEVEFEVEVDMVTGATKILKASQT